MKENINNQNQNVNQRQQGDQANRSGGQDPNLDKGSTTNPSTGTGSTTRDSSFNQGQSGGSQQQRSGK